MKYNRIYKNCVIAVLFLLGGCSNFLDQAPDDRVDIRTLEQAEQVVTGAYNDFGFRSLDVCTDNYTRVTGVSNSYSIIEDLYTWSRDFRDQEHQDCPSTYWEMSYGTIATVNHALEELEQIDVQPDEKAYADAIRGEALLIRSYQHFMLVNVFAKHYNKTTAAEDLGVPYVKTVEKQMVQHYERNTIEEVYEEAEKDLLEAIRLLEANPQYFKKNKYHFTFATMYLYASRFYTWRNRNGKDVEDAIKYADKSIAAFGGMQVMRDWIEYGTDYNGQTDITQAEVGMVQECDTWTVGAALCYSMTISVRDKYFKKNPFGFSDYRIVQNYSYPGDMFVPAFYFVIDYQTMKTATDIFPLAEAMLNAAEGYTRQGLYNNALTYLHELGKHVYKDYNPEIVHVENLKSLYNTTSGTDAMIQYILFERRIQFLCKGMRWFDIRRYNLEVEHVLTNGEVVRLSEVAPERCFQIPRYAIQSGMQPNK